MALYDQANASLSSGRRGPALASARAALSEAHARMAEARRLLDAQRTGATGPPSP